MAWDKPNGAAGDARGATALGDQRHGAQDADTKLLFGVARRCDDDRSARDAEWTAGCW
jgi:hypothetical protein